MRLVSSGRHHEAISKLRELLHYTYVRDTTYDDWLRALADSYRAINRPIPAGYIYLYLHYFDMAHESFTQARAPLHLAVCEEIRGNHREASRLFMESGRHVRAAINLEAGKEWGPAVNMWGQARDRINRDDDPFPYALATVNLALALRQLGELEAVRPLFVEAIQRLEALADEWEGFGFLEEALSAYHVLCLIGQTEQRFENLAEGYCNAIRLLREQGQTYRVFRYYAALAKHGSNLGEDQAVASLHRETADYALRTGTYYRKYYLNQAAEAYIRVANNTIERGTFLELAENAYLAAIDAYNQMGHTARVEFCYTRLASLELDDDRRKRYTRLASEMREQPKRAVEVYPPSRLLRTPPELPPVWRDELVEWEAGDDAMSVLTSIVWNLEFGDVARRQALNLIFYHLDLKDGNAGNDANLLKEIATAMGGLRYNIAYKTLRRLMDAPFAEVRAEVMVSSGRIGHPRGIVLIEMGFADESPKVREAAIAAIAMHTYPEAYDHLTRIYSQQRAVEARSAVLATLRAMRSFEAAEFLWNVLRTAPMDKDEEALHDFASDALRAILTAEWQGIFRGQLAHEPADVQERLRAVFGARQ